MSARRAIDREGPEHVAVEGGGHTAAMTLDYHTVVTRLFIDYHHILFTPYGPRHFLRFDEQPQKSRPAHCMWELRLSSI